MKHKWEIIDSRTSRCVRCDVRTTLVSGPRGGAITRWKWNDGTHEDTNKTPPCSGHLDAK